MSFNNNYLSLNKYAKYSSMQKQEDFKNTNKMYLESMITKIKSKNIDNLKKDFDKSK